MMKLRQKSRKKSHVSSISFSNDEHTIGAMLSGWLQEKLLVYADKRSRPRSFGDKVKRLIFYFTSLHFTSLHFTSLPFFKCCFVVARGLI